MYKANLDRLKGPGDPESLEAEGRPQMAPDEDMFLLLLGNMVWVPEDAGLGQMPAM